MQNKAAPPLVLIVDDDPSVLAIIRRRFHAHTSLGVLVADDLSTACDLVERGDLMIKAVVTDLAISAEKQSANKELRDGIDFLTFVSRRTPAIALYVMSVWSEESTYRERAAQNNLPIRAWIPKLMFDSLEPWAAIEAHLRNEMPFATQINTAPLSKPEQNEDIRREPVIDETSIRCTYIQELGGAYRLRGPVRANCLYREGNWVATLSGFALDWTGTGSSVDEALQDLQELIGRRLTYATQASAGGYEADLEEIARFRRLFVNEQVGAKAIGTDEREHAASALYGILNELKHIINDNPREEVIQTYLQDNHIVFHQFSAKIIINKPPILNLYAGDFAIITSHKELVFIEIERADIILMRKNGDQAGPLTHAINQVQNWLHVVDEHRLAVLAGLRIDVDQVASIRGVVIAGRDSSYDSRSLRRLKARGASRVTVLTYDDLISSLETLIAEIMSLRPLC